MKAAYAILIAVSALSLTGCVLGGKPQVVTPAAPQPVVTPAPPPPPPQPLSMPQTQVQLPPAQPVDLDALTPAPLPEAPAGTPPPVRTSRPRPRPQAPPATVTETAPPPPAAAETERPAVREVLPEPERARLQSEADLHKREIRNWLASSRARRIPANDPTLARIRGLLEASDEAENKGDIRGAADLADRALLSMRGLQK
ncbi:MAG TPA: hypothetical protein VG456_10510 [Candidatus Sulfopaludibacter sp.]|jgi:hypothetical protein|nr:hypothetical protein [Candidatus Sulfopaludibacter sp.]